MEYIMPDKLIEFKKAVLFTLREDLKLIYKGCFTCAGETPIFSLSIMKFDNNYKMTKKCFVVNLHEGVCIEINDQQVCDYPLIDLTTQKIKNQHKIAQLFAALAHVKQGKILLLA